MYKSEISHQHYALNHDKTAIERLEYQNKLLREKTEKQLIEAGLTEGMTALDIGCGTGPVTLFMSKMVSSQGQVIALDMSDEKLALVQKHADEQGFGNISTICADITTFNLEPNTFHLIYCRCVLMHLKDPLAVLLKVLSALKPGGKFVCQEPSLTSHHLKKEHHFLDSMNRIFLGLSKVLQVDYNIGGRLSALLQEAGFEQINEEQSQQMISISTMKPLLTNGLRDIESAIIKYKITTKEDLQSVYNEIDLVNDNSDNAYYLPIQTYAIALKP